MKVSSEVSTEILDTVVVASALSSEEDLKPYLMQAAFRKASRKMTLTFDAVKKLIALNPEVFTPERLAQTGLVLNSGFGEIEATGGFLKGLAESGVARPIFFQNSLHNSTTGFLAIQFGIRGPVFTVNHRTEGGHEALEIASTLINEGLCEFCLAVAVETVPVEFSGESGVDREGAAAVMFCSKATALRYDLPARLTEIEINKEAGKKLKVELPLKGLKSLLKFDLITRLADMISEPSK